MKMACNGGGGGGRSMAAAALDGGHATTSRRAMRGREGGTTRGNTATSQRKTTRGWCSERTTRGRDDGATRGDATTRKSERIDLGGEMIHLQLALKFQRRQITFSSDSDDIHNLAFPIEYHPFWSASNGVQSDGKSMK